MGSAVRSGAGHVGECLIPAYATLSESVVLRLADSFGCVIVA